MNEFRQPSSYMYSVHVEKQHTYMYYDTYWLNPIIIFFLLGKRVSTYTSVLLRSAVATTLLFGAMGLDWPMAWRISALLAGGIIT